MSTAEERKAARAQKRKDARWSFIWVWLPIALGIWIGHAITAQPGTSGCPLQGYSGKPLSGLKAFDNGGTGP